MIDLAIPIMRKNQDKSRYNGNYGRELLDVCKNNMLCIFNGRCGRDIQGKPTTMHGTTVYYIIGTPLILSRTKKFEVMDFDPMFSDKHCIISLCIYGNIKIINDIDANLDIENNGDKVNNAISNNAVRLGKWNNEIKDDFSRNVDIDEVNELLRIAENKSVHEVTTEPNSIIIEAAKKTFPPRKLRRHVQKKSTIEGYTTEYWVKITTEPRTKIILGRQQSHYKKWCKKVGLTRRNLGKIITKVKKVFIRKLRSIKTSNPNIYWSMLMGKSKRNHIPISTEDLLEFFKRLSNNIDEVDEDLNGYLHSNVDGWNDSSDTTCLNCEFTRDKIEKCIRNLKLGKSAGIDNIINEYIKTTANIFLPLYIVLFNKILNNGIIPEECINGLIIHIYKQKGDIMDPNNYRGITLLSGFGKLFTSVLNNRFT